MHTKNTFINFEGDAPGDDEHPTVRRQRSAPASAMQIWGSPKFSAIEEAALTNIQYWAAVAAVNWASGRPGRRRGRSSRRTGLSRGARSSGSSSCSGRSCGHSGNKWSSCGASGSTSGKARRPAQKGRCHQGAAGQECPTASPWASGDPAAVDRSSSSTLAQRGTPARVEAQSLSRTPSLASSRASAFSSQGGLDEVRAGEHANMRALSQRGVRDCRLETALEVGSGGDEAPDHRRSADAGEPTLADGAGAAGAAEPWSGADEAGLEEDLAEAPAAEEAGSQAGPPSAQGRSAGPAVYRVAVSNRFGALGIEGAKQGDSGSGSGGDDEESGAGSGGEVGVAEAAAGPQGAPQKAARRKKRKGVQQRAQPCKPDTRRERRSSQPSQDDAAAAAGGPSRREAEERWRLLQRLHDEKRSAGPGQQEVQVVPEAAQAEPVQQVEQVQEVGDASLEVPAAELQSTGSRMQVAHGNALALFTAKLSENAISNYLRETGVRRAVLAMPVDPFDMDSADVLQVQLGAVILCEAADQQGWGFGMVLAPKSLAGQRGCFRCDGMRPVVVEVQRLPAGERTELMLGSWDELDRSRSTGTQHRLRQKALLNRMRAAREGWEAKAVAARASR